MKTKFKLAVYLLNFALIFSACSDDDNPANPEESTSAVTSISGKISNWNLANHTVKLIADTDVKAQYVAAEASISSTGEFTLKPLKDVPDDYLYPLRYDLPNGVNCSNVNLKTIGSYFNVYEGNNLKGQIYFRKTAFNFPPVGDVYAYYYYADGNAEVTGGTTYEEDYYTVKANFDVTVKKGWNVYYEIYEAYDQTTNTLTLKYTDKKPDGGEWVFSYKK